MTDQPKDPRLEAAADEYRSAVHTRDLLVEEAQVVGERLERLGRTLMSEPASLFAAIPAGSERQSPGQANVVQPVPLPSIEQLLSLAEAIRDAESRVEELRERLVLAGRTDVVQDSGGYFR